MKLHFNKTYFIAASLLFVIECLIAVYLTDGFIRHTFGDFLVVILLYCFIKSFLNLKPKIAGIIVLIIAFCIEFLQLSNLLEFFNLQNSHTAKLILGSTFQVGDLVAYTLGIITILIIESIINFRK